ncbi:MAG: Zonular occludens toxin [Betaproteobacteria bacterium]|nr:Zonular occludens toxin [Betaproteobacteria bacterium]
MAINCYCGLQGSGKSYEVVSSVILEAVAKGRRIVTNVSGIDEDRIHEFLVNKRDADPEKLGRIVHVTNDRIMQPQFFPDEEKPELESVVQGGDLVAVDEAWRFWGTDLGKLSAEHMQFFRMHRHYVHPETSVACDVALMTQDVTGLHRSVKNVIEFTFKMQKHQSLGLAKRYRVDIHEGWKINGKTRIDHRQKAYDATIFPLYQSYAGGQGTESAIDKRQNIFGNRTLWMYAGGLVVLSIISGVSVWRFFHASGVKHPSPAAAASSPKPVAPAMAAKAYRPPFSDAWHIVGQYQSGSDRWVVVADDAGRLRVESPSVFTASGPAMVGDIDGARVTFWTGRVPK